MLVTVFALLGLICLIGTLSYGAQIANNLRSRGMSAHPLLIRFMIFRYMAVYRRVTVEETGEVGPLYGPCSTFGTLTLVFLLAAIATRFL